MLTKEDILKTLDHCDDHQSFCFINLEHPYVYLIDCRLNIFRNAHGQWAIVSEVLGYNTRSTDGFEINLELRYFGNCFDNPGTTPPDGYNYYLVFPVDEESLCSTLEYETLIPGGETWLVRNAPVSLPYDPQEYEEAGIELREKEEGQIRGFELARLLAQQHPDLFRATEDELYRYLPDDMEKVLVLDEWHHKEFSQSKTPFEQPAFLAKFDTTNPDIREMIRQELEKNKNWNIKQWENRPGSYETWQQIADVIISGDPTLYRPSLPPNSHWSNWPEGGSM